MTEPAPSRRAGAGSGYPDPAVLVLDPLFKAIRVFNAAVDRIATGCRWAEGPVWFGDHQCLIWSDIPNDRMLRCDERTGETPRLPAARRIRQRRHPRPGGTAGFLRAPRLAG